MPRSQRIAMLAIAAIIAVVAVIALGTGGDDETPAADRRTAQRTATTPQTSTDDASDDTAAAPQAAPAPKPKPKPPLLTAATARTLTYNKGDTVVFRVRNSSAEEVHVHGYDIARDLPAGKTITLRFTADLEGIYEVELEQSGTPLG